MHRLRMQDGRDGIPVSCSWYPIILSRSAAFLICNIMKIIIERKYDGEHLYILQQEFVINKCSDGSVGVVSYLPFHDTMINRPTNQRKGPFHLEVTLSKKGTKVSL